MTIRSRMRILYVTNDLPWPLTSGYLRHFHFIRALSERHAVTLLSLERPGHDARDAAALAPYTERVVTLPASIGRQKLAGRVGARIGAIVAGGDRRAAELGSIGARLHAEEPFDVLLLSGKRTFPVLDELPALPIVADLCDATSTRIRRQIVHAGPIRGLPLALEYVEIRRVERALMRRARSALFASVRDRDAIAGPGDTDAGGATPVVVPNGVDLAVWQRTGRRLGDAIVLTGAMDYVPNADAAVELASRILPLVRRDVPDARVVIVGRDPGPAVQALAQLPGVSVTGFVEDVKPYLEDAAVFAAPLRIGAGIQNKVLEAMAMEVPVVATPLAADGLRTEDAQTPPIDVAAGPDALATAIVRRLRAARANPEPDPRLREYVAANFDWSVHAARVEELLSRAAGSTA